jgi:non-specific serine/threonine protein kinase
VGDRHGVANGTTYLGLIAYFQEDYARARRLCERGLAAWREVGDRRGAAEALRYLGMVFHALGDDDVARSMLQESLDIRRTIGDQSGVAESSFALGELALDGGDLLRAAALLQESLSRYRRLGDRRMVTVGLIHLAGVAAEHEPLRAAHFLGAVEAALSASSSTLWPGDERRRRQVEAAVRAALGDATYQAARAQGAAWSLDIAVTYAVDCDLPLPPLDGDNHEPVVPNATGPVAPASNGAHRPVLTTRERMVVHLVTQGLTNREIADRLVITQRTAASHLEHIRTKLGVRSRTQVVAWATRQGVAAAGD